jgi:hypothetical protein
LLLFLFLSQPQQVGAELISLTVGAGAAVGALGFYFTGLYEQLRCRFYECCSDRWLHRDVVQSESKN